MQSIIVVGTQWGDEGKGKVVHLLSKEADMVIRSQGGNNAGHTIVIGQEEFKLHLVPSGILYPHTRCFITGGTVIDPQVLLQEIALLEQKGIVLKKRLFLSPYAHVILPYHRLLDTLYEKQKGAHAIGTTGRGVGPCYMDKAARIGIRICELVDPLLLKQKLEYVLRVKNRELTLLFEEASIPFAPLFEEYLDYGRRLLPYVDNAELSVADALAANKKALFEGAHGVQLDNTFGTYPFVTSSPTIASGVSAGSGVGPSRIAHTLGVVKAYTTRVGAGPLPTALSTEEEGVFLQHAAAREIGTTTGRKRRIGWFDTCLVRFAIKLSGIDSLAMMKLDILDGLRDIKICTGYKIKGELHDTPPPTVEAYACAQPVYESVPGWRCATTKATSLEMLPKNARNYLDRLQEILSVSFSLISVGPEYGQTIFTHAPHLWDER